MTSTDRDRGRGAGYEYQWDVAVHLVLSVLMRRGTGTALDTVLTTLGEVQAVQFDGDSGDERLEDLGVEGTTASCRIQVKEGPPQCLWKQGDPAVLEVLGRAFRAHDDDDFVVLLSNNAFRKELHDLVTEEDKLEGFCVAVTEKRSKKPDYWKPLGTLPALPEARLGLSKFRVVQYHPATGRDADSVPVDGVGQTVISLLSELGVREPQKAFVDLRDRVMSWSFAIGGTRLSIDELRARVVALLGLRPAGFDDLIGYLDSLPDGQGTSPSLHDLRTGSFLREDALVSACRDRVDDGRVLLVYGPAGAGKSALVRIVGWDLHESGWLGFYWDFEHRGPQLPDAGAQLVERLAAEASILARPSWILLENVHLQPELFQGVLEAARSRVDGPVLVATSRVAEPLLTPSDIHRELLQRGLLRLEPSEDRGFRLLEWWLQEEHALVGDQLAAVVRSARWRDYFGDFQALRLAFEGFDFDRLALPAWAAERRFIERLRGWEVDHPRLPDFLYVVSALGRADLPADAQAVGRMLGLSTSETGTLAAVAEGAGLLHHPTPGEVRFWHRTVAATWFRALRLGGWSYP